MSRCLVLGASGCVGSRLVPVLADAGHDVRALVRTTGSAARVPRLADIRFGDVTEACRVRAALDGIDVVYHLVHSLGRPDFAEVDREAARVVAAEADRAGVRQIVYLGGPRPDAELSEHLASRAEVGDVLATARTPALLLEASMIIGRGSASFELLRQFAHASPVLPRAAWMSRTSRPVGIDDVLHHLSTAAALPTPVSGRFALSGPEQLSYFELVQRCARVAGLPVRIPVPAPLWSHRLAARAAALATTVPAEAAAQLFESLDHDLVDTAPDRLPAPPGGPTSVDNALRAAMAPAASASAAEPYLDERVCATRAGAAQLWRTITSVGGSRGWFTIPFLWEARGLLDHLAGGAGLYRGRQAELACGDVVDFWTVEHRDDARRRLVLRADMKMPGSTLLEMSAETAGAYRQKISFVPRGPAGHAYWRLQKPAHDLVFGLMARNLVHAAERG
ncbi:DUF2867 domain-containing protein [Amycolatopsis magusensis]|uniref:DUF2867 domain-containing protein n=1 Tax=Amycolatopsis magusensis TaxID=882444 RepID=UPI0024A8A960|nr:DUF2867 domain-containing protein [Amycolatopsis magusensis]MDI5975683.1 DUF2867 domain-containing protein [Amycolatopsis magusensis]